jgi:hypothetical protein
VIGGLHFPVLRLLLLCVWGRLLVGIPTKGRFLPGGLTTFDKVFVAWVISSVITFTLLWAYMGAFINKLGFMFNAFGIYFFFRHVLRTHEDAVRLVRALAIICALIGVLMVIEQTTDRNLLSSFGQPAKPDIRVGRIRSQGPFMHSIIAGTVGAMLIPVFFGLWWTSRKSRVYAGIGVIAGTIMTITSASSTPIIGYAAGVAGTFMWPLRRRMRQIRWAVVGVLIALQMVMKAPVWALIARVDITGGSTGYHRFELVDNFIRHFGDWWLVGTRDNAKWGFDMWDTCNWYVSAGESGGLIGLALFIAIIVLSFANVGRCLRSKSSESNTKHFAWSLGAALFGLSISFIGIAFFDQSTVFLYVLLAMITNSAAIARQAKLQPASAALPKPDSAKSRYCGFSTEPTRFVS